MVLLRCDADRFFTRQIKRQADVGILSLGEFEIQRPFPALFPVIEIGILLG